MNEDAYVSDEEELECPLCMEEFDISDRTFKPCPCGYQICRFCYNRIVNSETANGCPACRRQYTEETVEFKPLSAEEWKRDQQRIHSRKLKEKEKRESEMASRRHLSNMRVVQKNLVYVIGFSPKSADADLAATLRGNDYFAQYGKINKIVVNKKSHPNGQPTVGVYITYAKKEDAARAVQAVDNTMNDGRVLRASFGTTKYCSAYLRQQVCQNPNCMYLHEPGEDLDSYTREDMSTIQHAAKAAEGMHANALAAHHMRRQPSRQDSTGTSNQDDGGVALPATASWASMPKPSESTQTAQEAGQTSGNDQEHTKPDSLPPPAKGGNEGQGQIPPPPSQAAQGSIHPSELLPPPVQPGLDHPILGSTLKTFFEGRFNFNFVPRVVPGLSEADIKSAESFPQLFAWNPQQRRPASPSKMGKNHARSGSRYAFAADSRTPPPGFIPPGLATGSQPPGFTGGSRQAKDGSPDFFSQFLRNANPLEEPNATQPNYDDPAILGRSESLKSPPLMAANNSTNGRSSQSRVEAGQRHSSNGSQTTGPSQVSATVLADMPSQNPGKPSSGLETPEIEKPQSKFGASFAKLENLEHQAQEMTARTDQKARGMWEPTTRSKDELSRPTLATMAQSADVHLEVPNPRMLPKSSGTWQPSPPPPKGLMSPSPKPNAVLTGVSKVGPSMKNASKVPWEPSPPPSTIARAGSPRKTVPLGNSGLNASSSNNDARTQSAILTPDEFPSLQSVTNAVELIAPVAQTPARKTWDPVAPVAAVPIPPQTPKGRAALSRRDSTMSLASSGPDHGRSRQNSLIEPPLSRFGTPSHETSPGSSPLVSRAASPVTTPQLNRTLSSLVATPAVSSPLANLNTGKQIRIVSSKSVDETKAKEEKAAAEQKAIQKMKDDEIAAAAAKSTIRKSVPASSVKKTKEQKQAEQREKAERRERESTVSSQPDETPVATPTEIAPIVGRARKQKNKQQQQQQAQHKTHASPSRPSTKQATPEVSEAEAEVEAEVEEGEEEEEATKAVSVPAGESTKTAAASDAITALAKELDLRQFKFFQPIPSLNHGFEFSAEEIAKAEELAVYTNYDARESVAVLERYLAEARRDVLERFKAVEKCQRRNLKFANVSMIQSS